MRFGTQVPSLRLLQLPSLLLLLLIWISFVAVSKIVSVVDLRRKVLLSLLLVSCCIMFAFMFVFILCYVVVVVVVSTLLLYDYDNVEELYRAEF